MKTSLYLFAAACLCFTSLRSETLFVTVYNDSVTIYNTNVHANCASRYVFDISQSHDSIIVVERDTSMLIALCMCNYDLAVTMQGLEQGHYIVLVYRKPSPAYQTTDSVFVGTTEFTIGNSSLMYLVRPYQGPCGGTGPGIIIENEFQTASTFALFQNYPNPFNPITTIRFMLHISGFTSLKVFDVIGREVATLVNGEISAGEHSVQWNASGMPSGVYFYRLQAGNYSATKKLMLIK